MHSTFSVLTEVTEERRVVIDLPPDTPLGETELIVHVASKSENSRRQPDTNLADWARENAEDWGNRIRSDDVSSFTGRRFQ